MNGIVKRIVGDKGFGFIASEDREFFFHRSAVQAPDRFEHLAEGDQVVFEEEKSDKGPRACNVRQV